MAYLTPTTEVEDLGGGRKRLTAHAKAVAYDDGGTLRPIVTDWVDSGVVARPHMVSAAKVMVSVGDDGMRRIHPTHEVDRYLEIGAPYVRVGGVWTQVSLGTPIRSGNLITWTRPQTLTRILHGGHYIKLDIELLGGYMPANRRVAFPVGINGLTRDGLNILRDGVAVGQLRPFVLEDAANPDDVRPIAHQFTTLNGQPYLLLTLPDSTGMARPRIDPTYTDGYGGDVTTAKDTRLQSANSTANDGIATLILRYSSERSLIEFDCSAIPASATCDSATLTFYQASTGAAGAFTLTAYSVAVGNEAWIEGTKNNATAAAGEPTWAALAADGSGGVTTAWAGSAGLSTSGTDYEATALGTVNGNRSDAAGTAYDIVMTGQATRIAGWFGVTNTNYGVLLLTSANVGGLASSDHATTGYRPKLVVTYTEAGGTTYNQAATGSITPTGATVKATGKPVVGSLTPGGALARTVGKALAGAITATGTVVRTTSKVVAGAITATGALAKSTGKTLAGALTPAATLAKTTSKSFTGAMTASGTLTRTTAKVLSGAIAAVGGLIQQLYGPSAYVLDVAASDAVVWVVALTDTAATSLALTDAAVTNVVLSDIARS